MSGFLWRFWRGGAFRGVLCNPAIERNERRTCFVLSGKIVMGRGKKSGNLELLCGCWKEFPLCDDENFNAGR